MLWGHTPESYNLRGRKSGKETILTRTKNKLESFQSLIALGHMPLDQLSDKIKSILFLGEDKIMQSHTLTL